jgi:hypothetical protein
MELFQKIKVALDEIRMLILGAEVLVGFQFRAVFEQGYDRLPDHAHVLMALATLLMVAAIALLIAPTSHHRLVYGGEDSGALHQFITTMAAWALLPFAASLALDLFIVIEQVAGTTAGIAAGAGFGALALFWWYGFEYLRRSYVGRKERAMSSAQEDEVEKTSLHTKIDQMLTEGRVILPGVQALLGFQLAIVLTAAFEKLPETSKTVHALSLGLMALTIILLMTPPAYHRIVCAGEDTAEFYRLGSWLVTVASIPLALGLSGDVYVVLAKIAGSPLVGVLGGLLALAVCTGLWHVYPALRRRIASPSVRRQERDTRAA